MSARTPPPTIEEQGQNAETFLGPTGSETEEFYSYQRRNPGLEKGQYLEWFQKRFNKEIELRRRRSDQPSDLEFMVIKKRSKYRERIGEESVELVAYSEQNPHKTYRELAQWFQKRFNKEIDITAISRMLKKARHTDHGEDLTNPGGVKRSREGDGITGGTDLNPDQTPPMLKRGRRSLPVPGQLGGMSPRFAVDFSGKTPNPTINGRTPNHFTPTNRTPEHRPATLPRPDERTGRSPPNRLRELPPPAPHPQMQAPTNGHPESPRRPMWASVNANGNAAYHAGHDRRRSRSPPRQEPAPPPSAPVSAPPPPPQHQRPTLPSASDLAAGPAFSSSHPPPALPAHSLPPATHLPPARSSYPHGAPPPPNHQPTRLPPVTAPPPPPPPPLAAPATTTVPARRTPPRPGPFEALQSVVRQAERANEELRRASEEALKFQLHQERLLQEETTRISALIAENEKLRQSMDHLNKWNQDLQRGNIELQQFSRYKEEYEKTVEDARRVKMDNEELQRRTRELEQLLAQKQEELTAALSAAPAVDSSATPSTRSAQAERKARIEQERWMTEYFQADATQLEKTQDLANQLQKASMAEIVNKISDLGAHLKEVAAAKDSLRAEWQTLITKSKTTASSSSTTTPSTTSSERPRGRHSPTPPTAQEDHDMQGGELLSDADDTRRTRKGSAKISSSSNSASASVMSETTSNSTSRQDSPATASTSPIHGAEGKQPPIKRQKQEEVDKMDEDE